MKLSRTLAVPSAKEPSEALGWKGDLGRGMTKRVNNYMRHRDEPLGLGVISVDCLICSPPQVCKFPF